MQGCWRFVRLDREEWGCVLAVLAAVLFVRLAMGFEFPIPWNDEAAFISQGFEFSRTGSFYVFGLNTERVVMWMPPGFMLLLAAAYKVFGYSFELSRWISCLLYLGAFGVALGILRSLRLEGWMRLVALVLTALAFVSPYSLAISNMARMEALYALLFLASLLAMLRERPGLGLALVLFGATVHFNAVYMLLPYLALIGWKILRRESLTLTPGELLALCLSTLALAAYGVFVVRHIGGFLEDMKFQFDFKLGWAVMDGPMGWLQVGAMVALAALQLVWRRRFCREAMLSLYAAGFMALALNGHNMWYGFAFVFALWLLLLSVLLSFAGLARRPLFKGLSLLVGCLLLLPFAVHGWSRSDVFVPLWPRTELLQRPFLAPSEIAKVRAWIATLPSETTVSFGYSGVEPFFFADLARAGVRWSIPGHSVTQVLPLRRNDYRVFCDSALFPTYLARFDWDGFPRKSADTGCVILPAGGER